MLSENRSVSQSENKVLLEKDIMLIHRLNMGQFCLSSLCRVSQNQLADSVEIT